MIKTLNLATASGTDAFVSDCPTRVILDHLADKWVSLVMVALAERPHYFGELRRRIEGVSKKMLTQTLRMLESYGLISRTIVHEGRVAKVRYDLTALGETLIDPLTQVYAWAQHNTSRLLANQEAHELDAPGGASRGPSEPAQPSP